MIDSHRHFWLYSAASFPWIDDSMQMLTRDFLPDETLSFGALGKSAGCIAVQAQQHHTETAWLLSLSETYPDLLGVVGWVDLCAVDAAAHLEMFNRHPRFVGVRHLVQDEADPKFLERADFRRGLVELGRLGLCYDLLVRAPQRQAAIDLVRAFPDQTFVLDHVGKPAIAAGELDPWQRQLRELAQYENVVCKLSGLCTEADWKSWRDADISPFVEIALACFGPTRLLFGSDYPVCQLAGKTERIVAAHLDPLRQLSPTELRAVTHTNAVRVYGLST